MSKKFCRTRWKVEELLLLRAVFAVQSFPDTETLSSIAVLTGKTPKIIKIWFQNSRQRKLVIDFVDFENALNLLPDM